MNFTYMCTCGCMYMQKMALDPQKLEGDTVDCAPPYVCWEPNMSSLEQEVL